jgi:hypothetical protein
MISRRKYPNELVVWKSEISQKNFSTKTALQSHNTVEKAKGNKILSHQIYQIFSRKQIKIKKRQLTLESFFVKKEEKSLQGREKESSPTRIKYRIIKIVSIILHCAMISLTNCL